jgi:N-acetylmuramoyl-L-alanine amidase
LKGGEVGKYLIVLFGLIAFAAHASPGPNQVLKHIPATSVIKPVQREPIQTRRNTLCLALGLYYEARGESIEGQRAVGHVILNRIRQTGDPACRVVWKHGQFSWTREAVYRLIPRDMASWFEVQWHALMLSDDPDNTDGATMFYNARLCDPKWAKTGVVTARYGDHVFIRRP